MWKAHFETFAAYNAWANMRLFEAAAALPAGAFEAERGAFFGSLSGTLNHILVADRFWLARLEGAENPDYRLDSVLAPGLPALRALREREDARITSYVAGLGEADFLAPMAYRNTAGQAFSQSRAEILTHLFNHQTHHRGQAHGILSQSGVEPPPLDLIYYCRTR